MTSALMLQHLKLSYGTRRVLNDVSFSVLEGEFFIITGPNGSGKTTPVKTMSGAARPQQGEVQIFGRPDRSYSGKALARCVAVVPQVAPVDIPFTKAEVVLMGRSPHLPWMGSERRKDLEIAERAMCFTHVEHLWPRANWIN
jgi:iron complex transport system ATP-binding protein